eukprot:TRINITY_DN10330_c0_g4_i1.p5 TRINITY_DN10330_c0_g4~~TRINITY_DN10330_c0_g4_i1.p5  ORF type:complete len:147 (-),score=4.50 TRINITY_DN10330_c0_g4_i1:809-1249(-)
MVRPIKGISIKDGMRIFRPHKLLAVFGEWALRARKVNGEWRGPLIRRRWQRLLRKECLIRGEEWPYEHIYPGIRKPKTQVFPKGTKYQLARPDKFAEIEKNLVDMDAKMEEARARRRLTTVYDSIPIVDRLFMTRTQLKEKYVRNK